MPTATVMGYCMKCKTQREIKDSKQVTMKNGRPATEGVCPVCGTRMFVILAARVNATNSGLSNDTGTVRQLSEGTRLYDRR
jgi:RNase P subunit RPR2